MSAISIENVEHRYGERIALNDVSFSVESGQTFGLLGPNGSGKTTLFKLLSTLMPLQSGKAIIGGASVSDDPDAVRRKIGVTFQTPSLDGKLSVRENLTYQGHLYGLFGQQLKERCQQVMEQLDISDRAKDTAEKLSGGLKRRVEIAKSLLHSPEILLLDEPSTGLDPGARHDLWQMLRKLQSESGVTILVTTHLMDEAEKCSRLVILDQGQLIVQGTPDELQSTVGGDSLTIQADDPEQLSNRIKEQFHLEPQLMGDVVRIERENGHELVAEIASAFPGQFRSLTLGKPTLEDVFIKLTGRRLDEEVEA